MRDQSASHRSKRVLATIVATIAAVSVFATLGGIGLANGVINLAQYQYGKKITICHKNKVTITISVNAWPAHQRHGDTIGPCQATGGKGHHNNQSGKQHGHSHNSSGVNQTTGQTGNGHGGG